MGDQEIRVYAFELANKHTLVAYVTPGDKQAKFRVEDGGKIQMHVSAEDAQALSALVSATKAP
jgi:hypothetical protein